MLFTNSHRIYPPPISYVKYKHNTSNAYSKLFYQNKTLHLPVYSTPYTLATLSCQTLLDIFLKHFYNGYKTQA